MALQLPTFPLAQRSPGRCMRPKQPTATAFRHQRSCSRRARPLQAHASTQSAAAVSAPLRLDLPTQEVQSAVRFTSVPKGRGVAVVIERVLSRDLSLAGLAPGQQLLGISDPVRYTEVWPLKDNASLRYVRDSVRMRRSPTMTLVLSPQPLPEWEAAVDARTAAASAAAGSGAGGAAVLEADEAAASGSSMDGAEGGLLEAIVASMDLEDQQPAGDPGAAATLGGRLEAASLEEQRQVSALQKRIRRRKDYLGQVSQRNDSGFFLTLFAAFVLPAFVILAVAYGTGYLDTLAMGRASFY